MSLFVQAFGSTSKGNATLIKTDETAVMVDCGLGVNYTSRCLAVHGLGYGDLDAVLLTHVHRDHINGNVLARLVKARVPLYCNNRHVEHLRRMYASARMATVGGANLIRTFREREFSLEGMNVTPFEVRHDAPGGTWGYRITVGQNGQSQTIAMSTDLGCAPNALIQYFKDADIIVLESNHDPEMLADSARPIWLKERIVRSHLSNAECSEFLAKVIQASDKPPQVVMLAHISQDCNTNDLALAHTRDSLIGRRLRIVLTHQSVASEGIRLESWATSLS